MADLLDELDSSRAGRLNLVILDACRDNPFKARLQAAGRSISRGLRRPQTSVSGTLIAYSTRENDIASDGHGPHSPYTGALLDVMDKEPELELGLLFRRVRAAVMARTENRQQPWEYGSLSDQEFFMRRPSQNPRPGPVGELRLDDLGRQDSIRKEWAQWQQRMKADFDKTFGFQGGADLHVKAWQRFLDLWAKDNPLASEDDQLRRSARSEIARLSRATSEANAAANTGPPRVDPTATSQRAETDEVEWRVRPASGPVVATFDELKNKGLAFAGKAGDPIFAAADGRVVYSGFGLRGFGNLVVIKHNRTYLTAYAHNRKLLVQEDQIVKAGQKIAEMGDSDADQVKLHFEVRKDGKQIDPEPLLPPR